ncbi:hypothetical protein CXB51_027934 [Gossypium anomalum]|uniref:Reverse transcriptase Ty1/copia-type domain-containing protein n=1 Tax=Gossypium anomalum TaxID=47600 RepID=A0A8J6CPV8_9ROSI|nr:hypothetical protein CXB51_027934 [Gossypium anomalum]
MGNNLVQNHGSSMPWRTKPRARVHDFEASQCIGLPHIPNFRASDFLTTSRPNANTTQYRFNFDNDNFYIPMPVGTISWCPNSGATHHVRREATALHDSIPYSVTSPLLKGDGTPTKILCIGNSILLTTILADLGILHRLSCPHMSKQNEVAKQKYKHIVETGLTLLAQANLSMDYWGYAFYSAVYLINRLPTPVLKVQYPYQILHGHEPTYDHLRVFGCCCFLYLRPFTHHKLNFHSQPCIFLGYSSQHKGYNCLTPKGKVIVSRHVVFDERRFLFSSPTINTVQSSQYVSTYVLLVQSIASCTAGTIERPIIVLSSPPHCSFTQSTLGGSLFELGYAREESRPSVSKDTGGLSAPGLVSLAPPSVPLGNTHTMVTRSKAKIFKPKFFTVEAIDYEPCTVEEVVVSCGWQLRKVDINNAFLNGDLTDEVFMQQPPGYVQSGPTSEHLVCRLTKLLHNEFSLKDMGDLHYFLGIEVTRSATGSLHLCQHKYIKNLLDRSSLTNAESVHTPMISSSELSKDEGYRLFMHAHTSAHLVALKRILRYLCGTIDHGLFFRPSERLSLIGYADANWGLNFDDRQSMTRYCVYFGDIPISWCSKKQQVVSRSTIEAEYRSLDAATSDITWLVSLLTELQIPSTDSPTVWCDKSSVVAVAANPVLHYKFKHVELDLFFVREKVAEGSLVVSELPALFSRSPCLSLCLLIFVVCFGSYLLCSWVNVRV